MATIPKEAKKKMRLQERLAQAISGLTDPDLSAKANAAWGVEREQQIDDAHTHLHRMLKTVLPGVEYGDFDEEMFAYSSHSPFYRLGVEIDGLRFGLRRDKERRIELQLHVWDCANKDFAMGAPVGSLAEIGSVLEQKRAGFYADVWGRFCATCEKKIDRKAAGK